MVSWRSSSTGQQTAVPRTAPDASSGSDDETAAAAATYATGATRVDAAADAMATTAEQLYKLVYAYAALAFDFLHAHGAVAYEFLHAHAVVAFEFVYAYATVAVCEALAVLEKACSWAKSMWHRLEERSPASVKRSTRHSLFPVMVSVVLSLLLVLPAYWAIPRGGGQQRLSAQEWQVSCPSVEDACAATMTILSTSTNDRPVTCFFSIHRRANPLMTSLTGPRSPTSVANTCQAAALHAHRLMPSISLRICTINCSSLVGNHGAVPFDFVSFDLPQQAKHDLLSSKHSADAVRQRLKYDSLAGRHLELQAEYDSLAKDFKHQQRAARTARNGPKVRTAAKVVRIVIVKLKAFPLVT